MTVAYEDEHVIVESVDRDVFLREYWTYKPGEHVSIIGPTQRGKSTLGFQLLGASASREMTAVVLWSKPRDRVISDWRKKLKFKEISEWPPAPVPLKRFKPRGYVLRPHQSLKDFKADNRLLAREFRACIMACYASKDPRIIFADEAQELQQTLGLKPEMEGVWKRGSAMDCGLWALAQRSAFNSQDMYNAPEHLFLFNDPDKRNRDRFGEIGGVNPRLVEQLVNNLGEYQVLYIKRTGKHLCVVNP
jgi:energy-coupling factor transporter ATP-binding protein EcfA2